MQKISKPLFFGSYSFGMFCGSRKPSQIRILDGRIRRQKFQLPGRSWVALLPSPPRGKFKTSSSGWGTLCGGLSRPVLEVCFGKREQPISKLVLSSRIHKLRTTMSFYPSSIGSFRFVVSASRSWRRLNSPTLARTRRNGLQTTSTMPSDTGPGPKAITVPPPSQNTDDSPAFTFSHLATWVRVLTKVGTFRPLPFIIESHMSEYANQALDDGKG